MELSDLPDFAAVQQLQSALWGKSDTRGAAVMIGAGFSRFARLASKTGKLPPLWNDFADEMRRRLNDEGVSSDPLKLADQYSAALGRHALDALIRELVCDQQWTPDELHARLMGLPWSDVMTTNWDTLLERTQIADPDRTYEVVRVIADIARTRAPRIIKLHGSLPAHEPLVFSAEDFRTYPKRFAPFVNLAQQIMLESELCLLGFSGDDPNFLQWAGWVRDQLGTSARKIRLIGVLNLSPSRRQLLEQSNISPIDLAPLVQGFEKDAGHRTAASIFIDSLWTSKPKPNFIWKLEDAPASKNQKSTELSPDDRIHSIVERWSASRLNYPGWLVAPFWDREIIRRDTVQELREIYKILPNVSLKLRAAFCYELIWRLEVSFFPLDDKAIALATEVINSSEFGLGKEKHEEIICALLRALRRRRNWSTFDSIIADLPKQETADSSASRAYERALRYRDELDFENLEKVVDEVSGDDPAWSIRRSALLCVLGEYRKAAEILLFTLENIRERRSRDRNSIWLLSREAWAHWLMRRASFTLRERKDIKPIDDDHDQWPTRYKAANCDPWDEISSIDRRIGREIADRKERALLVSSKFDAGAYRDNSSTIYIDDGSAVWSLSELMSLGEHVGLSDRFDHFDVLGSHFEKCLETHPSISKSGIWTAFAHIKSHSDGAIDVLFSRTEVACIPIEVVSEAIELLKRAIDYGRAHLSNDKWVSTVRVHTELISRLVVRLPSDRAIEIFRWALSIADDNKWNHWWLYKPLGNLLSRSLEAVHPCKRRELALSVIQMNLPNEIESRGPTVDWPEIIDEFRVSDFAPRGSGNDWSFRISELIEAVREGSPESRSRAALRLTMLCESGALHKSEEEAFGRALWSQTPAEGLFPEHTRLYGHIFLRLPCEELDRSRKVFSREIVDRLANGEITAFRLTSLAGSAWDKHRNRITSPISANKALEIFLACLKWRPRPPDVDGMPNFLKHDDDEISNGIGSCLSEAVLPVLSIENFTPAQIDDWVFAIVGGIIPTLVQTAAEFVRLVPARRAEMISLVRRDLVSRKEISVNSAISSIHNFIHITNTSQTEFPEILSSDIVSLCAARRQPGLASFLRCARDLMKFNITSIDDQKRLIEALEILSTETNYSNWDTHDPRTSSLGLIRRECILLADQLAKSHPESSPVLNWLSNAQDDPIPEVRFALAEVGLSD